MLDRERYRPELVVWDSSETDVYGPAVEALGIPIHRFRVGASGSEKVLRLRRLVRKLNPEVVHSFSFYTNVAAWWAVKGSRALAVGAVRSEFSEAQRDSGLLLGRLSARWPRHQIFNSKTAADSIGRAGFFVPSDVHVVRNGVDVELFRCAELPANEPVRLSE